MYEILNRKNYDALLVDLDGVLTKTAAVHALVWKKLFDEFLKKRAQGTREPFAPFDIVRDYRSYVDGLPRYKGVATFLHSRNIALPYGVPEDDPDQETICGLGNRKNRYFLETLQTVGVERYEPAVEFIHKARSKGFTCAIVTSSKNGRIVLEKAGLTDLFKTRVDGVEIARLGLQGKPDPDMFLEAAKRLQVAPERAVVVEDALSGVEAGRKGGFGLVIGVNRIHPEGTLLAHGADWEVSDLSTIILESPEKDWSEELKEQEPVTDCPLALERVEELTRRIENKSLAVFLDYDGTLTPIVDRPEAARLSGEMKQRIEDLARHCHVAIVSGRDRADVEGLVGLDAVTYAGSHGFDIRGPDDLHLQHEEGNKSRPALEAAGNELDQKLEDIAGTKIERKAFAVTIHYRLVEDSLVPEVKRMVETVAKKHSGLRITGGKKILELRPDIDWNKGKAVLWLLEALKLKDGIMPMYLGDDETDEDAFAVLREYGMGIVVASDPLATKAHYRLRDPEEVQKFLLLLTSIVKQNDSE